jgi:hypothetical protein
LARRRLGLRGAQEIGGEKWSIATSKGNIHIDSTALGNLNDAATIIVHEATHKFASTLDFGRKGYTAVGSDLFVATDENGFDYTPETHLQADEAINNADSYAVFVKTVYTDGLADT